MAASPEINEDAFRKRLSRARMVINEFYARTLRPGRRGAPYHRIARVPGILGTPYIRAKRQASRRWSIAAPEG
jgi:hypothetical protein